MNQVNNKNNSKDYIALVFVLEYLKAKKYSFKSIGETIDVSPNMLYYIRSTSTISKQMLFYIMEQIKLHYPEEMAEIKEQYDSILNNMEE